MNCLKLYVILCCLILIQSCGQADKRHLHNGMNETRYPGGALHERFYADSNKLNGVYVEYNNKAEVIKQGTYQNDKRNGLWDSLTATGHITQAFYLNDGLYKTMDSAIPLQLVMVEKQNLMFLKPKNWLKGDIVDVFFISGNCPGDHPAFTPEFQILAARVTVDSAKNMSVKELMDMDVNQGPDLGPLKDIVQYDGSVRTGPDRVSFHLSGGDIKLIFDTKVIKNEEGFWSMTCSSTSTEYDEQHLLFETMLTSFSPLRKK